MTIEGVAGLRVLGFTDHLPFRSSGGSERVAWEVYRRMVRAGASVTLLAGTVSDEVTTDEIEGVRIVTIPALRLARWIGAEISLTPGVFSRAAAEVDRVGPEVLHANSLHFQSSVAAALLQQRRRVPLVTTVHLATVALLPSPLRQLTTAYERTVGRYVLSRSERVIAVSKSVASHVCALGVPPARVVTVPNGVDHDVFAPVDGASRDVPRLVMVGRLIANKGPDILLEALALLERGGVPFTAAFVGDGPMRADLERRARDLGIAGRLTFTGHVTDVASELRRADVLVRPSLTEGMPLGILEAMACGVCVVASDVPGTTDLVTDGQNGLLFPPRSVARLVAALRRVMLSPGDRARLAARGRETSLAYSWETSAAAAARVLADAARRAPSAA